MAKEKTLIVRFGDISLPCVVAEHPTVVALIPEEVLFFKLVGTVSKVVRGKRKSSLHFSTLQQVVTLKNEELPDFVEIGVYMKVFWRGGLFIELIRATESPDN